jgi:hypothetical protein
VSFHATVKFSGRRQKQKPPVTRSFSDNTLTGALLILLATSGLCSQQLTGFVMRQKAWWSMKRIRYYDVRMDQIKEEANLTDAEYNSRLGDLRMMEAGGKIKDIETLVD